MEPSRSVIAVGLVSMVLAAADIWLSLSTFGPAIRTAFQGTLRASETYLAALAGCFLVLGAALMVSGFDSFLLRRRALNLAFVYSWGTILLVIGDAMKRWSEAAGAHVAEYFVSVLGNLLYPVFLILFFTRPSVKAQFDE